MKTLIALLAFVAVQAHAQGVALPGETVPIPLQVQRLAPQLVPFAGSQGNFENLVNGLALGVPVTITTVGADGIAQTVTFTPPGGAVPSAPDIARTLEAARQRLIASGVAAPSAQQLGEAVVGAPVPVTVGTLPVQPGTAAAGGTVASPAQQIQSRDAPVAPQVNTSDSRTTGNTSDTPLPAQPAVAPSPSVGAVPQAPATPQAPAAPVTRSPMLPLGPGAR